MGMKRFFLLLLATLLLGASLSLTQAQTTAQTLYNQVISLPGCSASGQTSCAVLDGTAQSELLKTFSLERFVPGSGYLGVYLRDRRSNFSASGGPTLDSIRYEANSGDSDVIGDGLQVFERGNVTLSFEQPVLQDERLPVEVEVLIYFMPHSQTDRSRFLSIIQDDPKDFENLKRSEKRNISVLCTALGGAAKLPAGCAGADADLEDDEEEFSGDVFKTDPSKLPEVDFSGEPSRKPELEVFETERLVFTGQPVTLKVDQVVDPDGKCLLYEYKWQKPEHMQVKSVDVDARLGDLFFIPQNTGVFSLRLTAREMCGKDLGTLTSAPVRVRVIVNDKAQDFQDLQGNRYANAIYDLYHLGVLKGYADGTMKPDQLVNRAEFLKMVFETLQYRMERENYSPRYPDVDTEAWFSDYVFKADQLGVIKGYPDGFFRPGQTVNLVEALKMAMQFTDLEIMDGTVYDFRDVSVNDWFSRYVQTAYREGILDDIRPDGFVYPSSAITRGKAALIIVRTLLHPVNRINPSNKDVLRRPDVFEDFDTFNY